MSSQTRRAELYEDVEQHVVAVLRQGGIAPDVAKQAGAEVADSLANHFGGQVISFPRDITRSRGLRHAQILAKFNGRNYGELAAEFGYTERGIRKLLDRMTRKQGVTNI